MVGIDIDFAHASGSSRRSSLAQQNRTAPNYTKLKLQFCSTRKCKQVIKHQPVTQSPSIHQISYASLSSPRDRVPLCSIHTHLRQQSSKLFGRQHSKKTLQCALTNPKTHHQYRGCANADGWTILTPYSVILNQKLLPCRTSKNGTCQKKPWNQLVFTPLFYYTPVACAHRLLCKLKMFLLQHSSKQNNPKHFVVRIHNFQTYS